MTSARELREARLYQPVADWLRNRQFRVHAEAFGHDVVGIADGVIWIVELKMVLSCKLIKQAMLAQVCADQVYVAVPTSPHPRSLDRCRRHGLGILRVAEQVCIVMESVNTYCFAPHKKRLFDSLKNQPEMDDAMGGLPSLPGYGAAQLVSEEIARYRAEHPAATWAEIHREVPNHYVNAHSLCGAMRMLEMRKRRLFRLRKAET